MAQWSGDLERITMGSGADLTRSEFLVAKRIAQIRDMPIVAVADDPYSSQLVGLICSKPSSGGAVAIAVAGEAIGKAGAAINAGVRVSCDAQGRLVTATSSMVTIGVAQEACANANECIRILVQSPTIRQAY